MRPTLLQVIEAVLVSIATYAILVLFLLSS